MKNKYENNQKRHKQGFGGAFETKPSRWKSAMWPMANGVKGDVEVVGVTTIDSPISLSSVFDSGLAKKIQEKAAAEELRRVRRENRKSQKRAMKDYEDFGSF